jgi:hypothetical protein
MPGPSDRPALEAARPGYALGVSLSYPVSPSRKLIRTLDALLVLWTVVWVIVAALVTTEMRKLRELSDSLTFAGSTLDDAGRRLSSLDDVPFVGDDLSRVGRQLQEAGQRAVRNGAVARSSIDSTSLLLGVAIAGIPSLPLLALYVPMRWARIKEVRAVRGGLAERADDPAFLEFLARRAVDRLPYHVLREVSENPWRDLEAGRFVPLAEAELRRLGLSGRARGRGPRDSLPIGT